MGTVGFSDGRKLGLSDGAVDGMTIIGLLLGFAVGFREGLFDRLGVGFLVHQKRLLRSALGY